MYKKKYEVRSPSSEVKNASLQGQLRPSDLALRTSQPLWPSDFGLRTSKALFLLPPFDSCTFTFMEVLDVFLRLFGVLVIVFLNAFFVAAEFAIVKVRATQIEPVARTGSRRAHLAQHVITHLDTYLSACQLGITMTSLALGWVGEPFVASLLRPLFGESGGSADAAIQAISFGLGFAIITFLHIVLGEQAPKWLSIQYARETTLKIARPLHLFYIVFRPFIWVLNASAKGFLRLIGVEPASEADTAQSEEEIRLLLSKQKALSVLGRTISLRAIELRDRTVREVMVPRTSVVYLVLNKSIEENIAAALEQQFTRYPLCEESLDNVVGMIHLKDLFKISRMAEQHTSDPGPHMPIPGTRLLDIKREMLFVPETTPLERMLTTFLAKRVLMAIAVDEYGGTAGLVTLENVLEELVGEIRDEFDVETAQVQTVGEGEFLVDGAMPLFEFSRAFEVHPESRDVVTVSGYAIQLLGRVPEKGARVDIGPWSATVETLHGRTVKTLRLKRKAPAHAEVADVAFAPSGPQAGRKNPERKTKTGRRER
jgi:CBS domain containing-hemolysin-like protein